MNTADQWYNFESSAPMPDLHGKSDILEQQHIRELSRFLPARAEGYSWTLAFTTSQMGFSLKSLYRSLLKYEGPVLLIIKDAQQTVFGAFCSCSLQPSESFYGTGETYLFTFKNNPTQFKRYPWTGDNVYFIKGNSDSIVIGAGEGNFGLWLDEDLYHGSTHSCKTFNNEPLSNQEDFVVCALECWCFLPVIPPIIANSPNNFNILQLSLLHEMKNYYLRQSQLRAVVSTPAQDVWPQNHHDL